MTSSRADESVCEGRGGSFVHLIHTPPVTIESSHAAPYRKNLPKHAPHMTA